MKVNSNVVAIGSKHGSVLLIKLNMNGDESPTFYEFEPASCVFSLSWYAADNLFVSGQDGALKWFKMETNKSLSVNEVAQFTLPKSKHRWHTTAIVLDDDMVICGDRRGSIHLYSSNKGGEPISSHYGIHGKYGVTYLKVSSSDGNTLSLGEFCSFSFFVH